MQEDIEHRTVTLVISSVRLTSRVLKAAISKYLSYKKAKHLSKAREGPVIPRGKQTVKELVSQNQGVTNIEISDKNIKDFDRVARKYGIDYAVKRDKSGAIPKYLVFFKARDADALQAAFRDYASVVTKKNSRPSVIQRLRTISPLQKEQKKDKVRKKDKGLEL